MGLHWSPRLYTNIQYLYCPTPAGPNKEQPTFESQMPFCIFNSEQPFIGIQLQVKHSTPMESLYSGRCYCKLSDSDGVLGYTQISNTYTARPQRGRTKHTQHSMHRCLFVSSTPSSHLLVFNYMENIRLLWSRFVGDDCTLNYRTPLESQVIRKIHYHSATLAGSNRATPTIDSLMPCCIFNPVEQLICIQLQVKHSTPMESLCWGRLYCKLSDSDGVQGYTQISNIYTVRPMML